MRVLFGILVLVPVVILASPRNSTQIQYSEIKVFPKQYGVRKPKGAHRCKGSVSVDKILKFPWVGKEITRGIDCLPADFDGNGYLDFALLRVGWTQDKSGMATSEIIALMSGKEGIKSALPVTERHSIFTFEIYPPRAKKGKWDEPTTKNPGLVEWGEGDSTTVWLYQDGKFTSQDFPSESL